MCTWPQCYWCKLHISETTACQRIAFRLSKLLEQASCRERQWHFMTDTFRQHISQLLSALIATVFVCWNQSKTRTDCVSSDWDVKAQSAIHWQAGCIISTRLEKFCSMLMLGYVGLEKCFVKYIKNKLLSFTWGARRQNLGHKNWGDKSKSAT